MPALCTPGFLAAASPRFCSLQTPSTGAACCVPRVQHKGGAVPVGGRATRGTELCSNCRRASQRSFPDETRKLFLFSQPRHALK